MTTHPPAPPTALTPLSSDQRRLWFIQQLDPHGAEYNVDAVLRLRGPLDRDALVNAVRWVAERHEVLRTHVRVHRGEPYQVVDDVSSVTVDVHDVSTADVPVAAAAQLAREMAGRPFDVGRGPLFRAWLARLGEDDHVVGIVAHHLVFDRDSLEIWRREVALAYTAFRAGTPPSVAPLPAQFRDFAVWQRERAAAPARQQDREYWRAQLTNVPVMLELPTDRPRPPRPTHRAGEAAVRVPPEVTVRLSELAAAHHTTAFAPALAAFQALLLRYNPGLRALAVGCPFNARTRLEYEGLVGFFPRSLPIVVDLSARPDPTFDELTERAREALLAAHEHQELPLDDIVAITAPPRDLGHNPVFQVWFDLAVAGPTTPWLSGLRDSPFDTNQVSTRFDLELHLVLDRTTGLTGRLLYATDLFDHDTAQAIVGHYEQVLSAATRAPRTRLSSIALLTEGERDMIINDWGAGGRGSAGS